MQNWRMMPSFKAHSSACCGLVLSDTGIVSVGADGYIVQTNKLS